MFIFDGNAKGPEDLRRKREMFARLLANGSSGIATNLGDGIAQFGQALVGRLGMAAADRRLRQGQSAALASLAPLRSGAAPAAAPLMGGGGSDTLAGGTKGKSKDGKQIGVRLANDLIRDFGVSPAVAAGIVGNLSHESGGFNSLQEINPLVKGSRGGYGYAQWTGPRRRAFEAWSAANGLDPSSYEANYGFLKHELTNTPEGRVMSSLKGVDDPAQAATIFSNKFLRPGIPHMNSRVQRAQQFAQILGNQPTVVPASAPPSAPRPMQPGLSSPFVPQGIAPAPQPQMVMDSQPVPASAPASMRPMTAMERMRMNAADKYGDSQGGAATERAIQSARMGQAPQSGGGNIFARLLTGGLRPSEAPPAAMPDMGATAAAEPASRLQQLESVIFGPSFQWLEPPMQKFIMDQYTREQEKADAASAPVAPVDPLEVERRRLENEKLRIQIQQAQQPTKPGYRQLTPDEVTQLGLPPGSYQQNPDGKIEPIGKSGVNVTVNSGSEVGTIPQGFELFTDPATGARSMRPIAGGPAANEAEAARRKSEMAKTSKAQVADIVSQDIDRAITILDNDAIWNPASGFGSDLAGRISGSNSSNIRSLIDTIEANIGFDKLTAMRAESPTGGALGSVTERELALLSATLGNVKNSQSEQQLRDNLNRLWNIYQDVIHGPGQGPERRAMSFDQPKQDDMPVTPNIPLPAKPMAFDPSDIELLRMDPSPEAMREFDELYGPGAAQRALRGN